MTATGTTPSATSGATAGGSWVHTAEGAVPPLSADEELAGLMEDLPAIHPGIDLMLSGVRTLALERLTREQTQAILATLCGADGTDVLGLIGNLVRHLSDPDFNPCLRVLDADTQANLRRAGAAVSVDLDTTAPRDLVTEELLPSIDPYLNPAGF